MAKITLPKERQVRHLKVLRQQREISYAEFATLTLNEQLDIVNRYSGKQKYDLLLNSQNAEQLVPRLHPQELYLTINELGAVDSVDLLALSSPEQVTLLLDLDCWDGDTLSDVLSLRWLELIAGTGEHKLCQLAREIEPEIFALFLKKHLTIIRGIEAYDDDDAENSRRLESLYDIHYHSEDAAKIIGKLLSLWQENEQETYLLIMEMIRSENLSVLEEETFLARSNRLLDLGLIPSHEANSIYSYLDPDTFQPGGKTDYALEAEDQAPPFALLANAQPGNLLGEILAAGITHETACELLHLVNRKLSADKTDISDSKEIGLSLQNIYDTINLALEYITNFDQEKSVKVLQTTYLLHLFQLGHTLVAQKQHRVQQFMKHELYPYIDFPELLFIESLLETPALFYRPPYGDHPSELTNINTLQTLILVDNRIEQIESLFRLFSEKLPFSIPKSQGYKEEQQTLSAYMMTAVANSLLGKDFVPTPLCQNELIKLKANTVADKETFTVFTEQTKQLFRNYCLNCDFFHAFGLELWADFFLNLDETSPVSQNECFLILN